MELYNKNSLNFDISEVIKLHKAKTVHGINTIYCGGLIFDYYLKSHYAELLKEFSINLAIAGQIKNDIYDITRYAKTRGFTDILNGYLTYPLAKLMENLGEDKKLGLKELFRKREAEKIVELMKSKRIIMQCVEDCISYANKGKILIENKFNEKITNILNLWIEGNKINKDSIYLNQI